MRREYIVGFLIGIAVYVFTFGLRVVKVLIQSNWKFHIIQKGLYSPFNNTKFMLSQLSILALFVAGSITLYTLYRRGYFKNVKNRPPDRGGMKGSR